MRIAETVVLLMGQLQIEDVRALPPAERRRFVDLCKHAVMMVEKTEAPRAGVLARLHGGERAG